MYSFSVTGVTAFRLTFEDRRMFKKKKKLVEVTGDTPRYACLYPAAIRTVKA